MKVSSSWATCLAACSSLFFAPHVVGLDYALNGESGNVAITLTDDKTGISPIVTLFLDQAATIKVEGIEWIYTGSTVGTTTLIYETSVDGKVQATGEVDLSEIPRELLTEFDVGSITVSDGGHHTISVLLTVDNSTLSSSMDIQAYAPGVSLIPLLVVLLLSISTQMVEFSLFISIFVGGCMVAGNLKDGFKITLDDFLLNSLSDVDHGYVFLFTFFLSGLVGMMEKSGGMHGFTKVVSKYATTARSGQAITFLIGCFIFFDDYASALLSGESMRPLTDLLFVSREKLSFIADATAAPIASLSPLSSWVGFEVSLIQAEIDRLILLEGDNLTIDRSGLAVFLQSVKYRYYPWFMLIFMIITIFTRRDFGPMLIAERKTQIYQRTDGGDGKLVDHTGAADKVNRRRVDQPELWWNMILPLLLLIFFIFYLLVKTGDDGSGEQSFIDKLQNSDSYSALLWGTAGAAILTIVFYMSQIVHKGQLVPPTPAVIKGFFCGVAVDGKNHQEQAAMILNNEGSDEDASIKGTNKDSAVSNRPRLLMPLGDTMTSFIYGMTRIFPALIILILAWAAGSVMKAVGVDRLFSGWIVGGIPPESLPTLSFAISGFMALATGTSWGTMAILMPLILVPTYQASDGDATNFYATLAGVLSGAVAGDHLSPISDTTVLSALACDCQLMAHVATQAPYGLIVSIVSILFGTLPIGRDVWPSIVGILLGSLCLLLINFVLCKSIVDRNGSFDIVTELWMRYKGEESELHQFKQDTIKYYEAGGEASVQTSHVKGSSMQDNTAIDAPHGSDDDCDSTNDPPEEMLAS